MSKRKADAAVMADFGHKVRRYRMERGLSQQALAARLNISYQQVQKYEAGRNMASLVTAMRLAQVLGVPLADILPRLQED